MQVFKDWFKRGDDTHSPLDAGALSPAPVSISANSPCLNLSIDALGRVFEVSGSLSDRLPIAVSQVLPLEQLLHGQSRYPVTDLAAFVQQMLDLSFVTRDGGKKWLRLRVANLDNGATPSVQSALVRSLVLWIPFAFCCACIWTAISGGWSFFDKPYRQGLHDKAAKTVVVSTG
jgi:hypothetical protein